MNLPEKKHFLSRMGVVEKNEDGMTKWLKSLIAFSALLAILVFIDYALPSREKSHQVKSLVVRNGFEEMDYAMFSRLNTRIGEEEFWIIFRDDEWAVYEEDLINLRIDDEIVIYKTFLFGINIKAKNKTNPSAEFYPYINIYGFFIFFPFVFLILFVLMFYFRKNTEMIMTLGVIDMIALLGFGFLLLFY